MKLQVGDIFEFTFNENRLCYGQIVNILKKNTITITIFEGLYKSRPDTTELMQDNILFFGNTFDAKFYHKHWIIIDNNKSNLNQIKLPYYKIDTNPIYIEDFYENKIRKAIGLEEDILEYRSYIAPVAFELAIKAYYKKSEWNDAYNKLLYVNILKEILVVEQNDNVLK